MRGRDGPVALHSSPFTPFIIHPKQILFRQVSEDFGRGVCFNNEASFGLKHPFCRVPEAIHSTPAHDCQYKGTVMPLFLLHQDTETK